MGDAVDFVVTEIARAAGHLVDRLSGPMRIRLLLQPLVAVVLAVRAGLRDARAGRLPYVESAFAAGHARDLVHSGWRDVGRVFVVAVGLDVVYQVLVGGWVYPGEALVLAAVCALVPYVAVRGPVARMARRHRRGH